MFVGFMDEQWRCHQLSHTGNGREVIQEQRVSGSRCTQILLISIS